MQEEAPKGVSSLFKEPGRFHSPPTSRLWRTQTRKRAGEASQHTEDQGEWERPIHIALVSIIGNDKINSVTSIHDLLAQ